MTTIKDVAQKAGVSVGTVSRVLARNETVSDKMRHKVEAAVAELGYKPNFVARALRRRRADIIGLVVPDITNPFFAQLVKQIELETAKLGISVILANTNDDPAYEEQQVYTLLDRSPLGIVLVSALNAPQRSFDTDVKILALDRPCGAYPCIATDHEASAGLAAAHLIDNGHRRIAYVAGPPEIEVARARERGFLAGLDLRARDLGAAADCQVLHGSFDFTSGEKLGKALLTLPPEERPTGIAAASDQQAIGIVRAARDLDIAVPGDVSVVGFDDIPLAALIIPRLTTVRQSVPRLAEAAVAAIMNDGEPLSSARFPGRLIVRSSSGAARPDRP